MIGLHNFQCISFDAKQLYEIAGIFNNSQTGYIVCYQNESLMEEFGYKVNLLGQVPTSMCISGQQHTCYIYKRNDDAKSYSADARKCDPFFSEGLDICKEKGALQKHVEETINRYQNTPSPQRKRNHINYKE